MVTQNCFLLFQESMSGEPMNGNTLNIPSIKPQDLQLGQVEHYQPKTPVSDMLPRYKQSVSYKGCKVCIQVPASELHALIYSSKSMYGDAVLVPVSQWLRHQIDVINKFVEDNVRVPNDLTLNWAASVTSYYKPIYNGNNIFIPMSKYCRFTQDVNGNLIDLPSQPRPNFGRGRYQFTIEVPDVYMGPHKSGHLYTTNLRVTRIHFQSVAPNAPLTLVQNYGMPVSKPMSASHSTPINYAVSQSVRQDSPGEDVTGRCVVDTPPSFYTSLNDTPQTSAPMAIELDLSNSVSSSMAGMLPTSTMKPKRRRKAVISE